MTSSQGGELLCVAGRSWSGRPGQTRGKLYSVSWLISVIASITEIIIFC